MLKLRNKSKLIILLIIFVAILIISSFVLIKRNDIQKLILSRLEENELELIDLTVQVKNTDENKRNCLVTFTSNDSNEKIRSIEYPAQSEDEIPYVINCSENGKPKVAIDYIIEKGKEDSRFKITTTKGNIIEKSTKYTITYDSNGGDEINVVSTGLKGDKTFLDSTYVSREGYVFLGWAKDREATEPEINCLYEQYYTNTLADENVKLYAVWKKANELVGKDIINAVENINKSEKTTIYVYEEEYPVDVIYYNGDLTLDGTTTVGGAILESKVYEFGDKEADVATESKYAQNTVVLKVDGNLTINSGVTLTACKSDDGYGGPKGLLIYCTGTLTNNGTISMTARGAKAEGENVYLWRNESGIYEKVPAIGGAGASAVWSTGRNGSNGNPGTGRQTGGGAGGGANARNGCGMNKGGTGTSYSGGTGAGASAGDEGWSGAGSDTGGAGGYARGGRNNASRRRSWKPRWFWRKWR